MGTILHVVQETDVLMWAPGACLLHSILEFNHHSNPFLQNLGDLQQALQERLQRCQQEAPGNRKAGP